MASTKKNPTYRTNAGLAIWPHLNRPNKKFEKKFGVFQVTLRLPKSDPTALQLIKRANVLVAKELKAAKAAEKSVAKRKRIKIADTPYIDTDDGEFIDFNFKGKAGGRREDKSKWTWRPALFDPKGTPIDPTKYFIGGGSTLKVAYRLRGFYVSSLGAGVSLVLVGAQIIKFVAFGGPVTFEASGFAEEEGDAMESWDVSEVEEDDDDEDDDDDEEGDENEPDSPDSDPSEGDDDEDDSDEEDDF